MQNYCFKGRAFVGPARRRLVISKERVRCGGRSARIQASVHKAVETLAATTDRADLTVPMIAAEAGVTPSTIYRRWGDLSELLADVAVERMRPAVDPGDTGTLRTDLHAWAGQFAEEMASTPMQEALRDVLADAQNAKNVAQCYGYIRAQLALMLDRAAARDEPTVDIEDLVDHLVAPIIYRILFGLQALDTAYACALVDRLLPAHSCDTRPPPRHHIKLAL
jgi:AcrR family transcriptional regulator